MIKLIKPFLFTSLFALLASQSLWAQESSNPAQIEWQQWVDSYDQGRRSSSGWLSLAGLFWLEEGESSLGSGKQNRHRFPENTPSELGTVTVRKNQIFFKRSSNEVRIDQQDIDEIELEVDESIVSFGSYSFYVIERDRGFAIRLKNSENPAIAKYDGTQFNPYTENWRVPARLVRHKNPETVSIPTVYDTILESESAGWLEFEFQGQTLRLQAVSYGEDTPMALMFADKSNQDNTYPPGRFLEVEWPEEGDMTIIDFNFAYNPPCAITAFATCPLPPKQNRLSIPVDAGELYSQASY